MKFGPISPLFVILVSALHAQTPPVAGPCPAFPADSIWNTPVDTLPVDKNSANYINSISAGGKLRYDISIPVNYVSGNTIPYVPVASGSSEGDSGPYPFTPNLLLEGGSDMHAIV